MNKIIVYYIALGIILVLGFILPFHNIDMTIDQIIALGSSIGALGAARMTYITVCEMKQQREASYRPEMVFSRTFFESTKKPISVGAMSSLWVTKTDADGKCEMLSRFFIPLRNIGMGAAKNISVSWSFPIEKMISQVNDLAQRTSTPAYFTLENGSLSLHSDALGNRGSPWANQQQVSLDYVLPAAIQKEPTPVELPDAFILLVSAWLFLSVKNKDPNSTLEIPKITVHLEYRDIGDKRHTAVFEFKIGEAMQLDVDTTLMHGYLEPKKCG